MKRSPKGIEKVLWWWSGFNLQFYILCNLKATPNNALPCIAMLMWRMKECKMRWNVISPCIERSNGWELKRCKEKEKGSWNKWKGKVIQKGKVDNVHWTYEVKSCEAIVDHKKWAPMRWRYEVNNNRERGQVKGLTWGGFVQWSSGQWSSMRRSYPVGSGQWAKMQWAKMRLTLVGEAAFSGRWTATSRTHTDTHCPTADLTDIQTQRHTDKETQRQRDEDVKTQPQITSCRHIELILTLWKWELWEASRISNRLMTN